MPTIKSGLDNVASKRIPDLITTTGNIKIDAAEGNDVFRFTDINTTIDENGNSTTTLTTTTLNLNNEQTFYRTGGHNVKGYIDDRYALAAIAPKWLLNFYANKSGDIGIKSALAYQKDIPFANALQKVTNTIYLVSGSYGVARMTLGPLLTTAAEESSFFAGTKYTTKVWRQMQLGDYHAFPDGVTAFEKYGVRSIIKGGDGVEREMLRIPGAYKGKDGFFEFIKEADGSINHRLFRPN